MDYDQQLIEVYLDACEEDVRCRERLDALKMSDESRMAVSKLEKDYCSCIFTKNVHSLKKFQIFYRDFQIMH